MKINLAKSSGFCFGVKRALEIARQTLKSQNNIYMLGNIVHNEDVVREIKKAGIKKIERLIPGKNRTLLIRAHGASLETFKKARKLGYAIVDATCPMVKEIHTIVKRFARQGYKIIVIGDKRHDEVQGIIGQIKSKAIVIDTAEQVPLKAIQKVKKAAVVAQSTQNMEKVLKVVRALKRDIKELKFFNTICRPTRSKQAEIKTMPLLNDAMIIIGSKTSANTKRLYEISKSLNSKSYWVRAKEEVRPGWFKGIKSVGLIAGASTPDSTTQDVIKQIKKGPGPFLPFLQKSA